MKKSDRITPASVDYWRQLEIIKPEELSFPITMIGAGGIGSRAAFELVKMGVQNLTVMDHDSVEGHNPPSTMYSREDIGRPKVDGLRDLCFLHTGTEVVAKKEKFLAQHLSGVVISGVDSMAARVAIWKVVKMNSRVQLYIDGRMDPNLCQVFSVKPTDRDSVREYENTLPRTEARMEEIDAGAREKSCSFHAAGYNTGMAANLITQVIKRYAKRQPIWGELVFDFTKMEYEKSREFLVIR